MEPPASQVLAVRQRFEAACASLRPDLHRFCTRMTGTVNDGEDLLQEALVHAFYHLPELHEGAALRPWLFRIAHNCCIDWQRRRKALVPLDDDSEPASGDVWLDLEQQELAQTALAAIFTELPARERASVVLKDVLGYSLEETAEITASSTGAVKAALHRARAKLERAMTSQRPRRFSDDERSLLDEYVARFNQRDWAAVQALLTADARLEVVGRVEGPFTGQYFSNYAKLDWDWRIGWAEVEGSSTLVHFQRADQRSEWRPRTVIQVSIDSGKISRIRDYVHVPGLLQDARVQL